MWSFGKKAAVRDDRTPRRDDLDISSPPAVDFFDAIFEQAPIGMVVSDRDYRLVHMNKAFCDLLGYTREELARLRIVDITYPDDVQRDLALAAKLFQGQISSYEVEKHYVKSDGQRILAHLTCSAVLDGDGQPLYRVAAVLDITERRFDEESMEKKADQLRRQAELLDLAHDAILVRDLHGSAVVYWNRGAEETYGWSKLEALGQTSHVLLQTRFPRPLPEIEAEVRQHGRWEGDIIHTTRDGRTLVMASRWALQRDGRGEPAAILEINNDITREKQATDENKRISEHLRALMDATGDGVCGVDRTGCCTFVNQAGAALLGYRAEELLGKNMHALAHHTRRDGSPYPESECPIHQAFRAGKAVRLDNELLWRRDGKPLAAEYSCYPVMEGGSTTGAVMMFRVIEGRGEGPVE